ncbi:hypothetical protein BC830DRAFT_130899 [Chytriomyces sp. MP71]|nr:hypothetical protein BC830DRAFT_130899 [Chytriomyces sp. MP71]
MANSLPTSPSFPSNLQVPSSASSAHPLKKSDRDQLFSHCSRPAAYLAQLDGVSATVTTLKEVARVMHQELDDQLDGLGRQGKLDMGMKRLQDFIDANAGEVLEHVWLSAESS